MSEQSSTTMGLILMSLCWFSCRLPVVRLVWDCRDVPPWLERLRASTRVWIQLILPLPGGPATITPVTTSKTTHEHAKIILAKLGCKNYFGKVGGGVGDKCNHQGSRSEKAECANLLLPIWWLLYWNSTSLRHFISNAQNIIKTL